MNVGCDKEEEEEKSELEGTWATSCLAEKSQDGSIESHLKTTTVFGKDSYVSTNTSYTDADTTCTGSAVYVVEHTANYTVGADVATPAGSKILDSTPTKVLITLKTEEFVTFFNGGKFCGAEDWAIDVAKDVTTQTCGDNDGPMNAARYDIYDVEGTTLKLGDDTDSESGTTAAKRPTTLSSDVYNKL
jgi:hypothetical protein